jgi:hypothetical protein
VVPRQTCHLFTHNYLFEDFINKRKDSGVSNGRDGLRAIAEGGEVFHTVLYNPVREGGREGGRLGVVQETLTLSGDELI